jgi:hypothetical protein
MQWRFGDRVRAYGNARVDSFSVDYFLCLIGNCSTIFS